MENFLHWFCPCFPLVVGLLVIAFFVGFAATKAGPVLKQFGLVLAWFIFVLAMLRLVCCLGYVYPKMGYVGWCESCSTLHRAVITHDAAKPQNAVPAPAHN